MRTPSPFALALLFSQLPGLAFAQTSAGGASDSDDEVVEESDGKTAASPSRGGHAATVANYRPPTATTGTSTLELRDHWYLFIGAGYRGQVMPKFYLNAFVNEGTTGYFNTVRIEADFRKNGFSIVPSLSFTEYGTGDVLFSQKGQPQEVNGNWSLANSSLKALSANVDLLWSTPVHKQFDIEYGLGVGMGMTFGDLMVNWVYGDANGPYEGGGRRFSACQTSVNPTGASGCQSNDHSNSDTLRVGGYSEKSWFNGGAKPSIMPWLTPTVGVRWKPVNEFQARLGVGWSLFGPWFGLSGYYGLPEPLGKSAPPKHDIDEVIETSE